MVIFRFLSPHQNQLAYGDFSLPGTNRSPPCAGFFVPAFFPTDLRIFDFMVRSFPLRVARIFR